MVNKGYAAALFFFLTCFFLSAQSGFTTIGGANFTGYGRAGVNIAGIEGIYLNQAGLAAIKDFAVDISAEKRFNLQDLTNVSIAAAKTLKLGTIGVFVSNFGFKEYSEQKLGIAYARSLHPNLLLGGQFDILRYNIERLGSKNIYSFEFGMQLNLNKDIQIATHVFSPGRIEVNESTDIGTRFRLGVMYKPSQKVFLLVEADKLIYRSIEYKIGVSYQLVDEVQVRFGINPTVQFYSMGAMVRLKDKYRVSTAIALQDQLGNTPAISLQYIN